MTTDVAIEKLNDMLNKKEVVSIEIFGKCNENGLLVQQLNYPVKLNSNVSHKISLVSLEATSFFPNVTSANNKFYYSTNNLQVKEVTIPDGAYEFEDYDKAVKNAIEINGDQKDNITISINSSTAKAAITLKNNYRVYFDRNNTWRELLGFDSKVLNTNGTHISDKIANIVPIQKIFLLCDICKGSLYNKDGPQLGNILYSFPNSKKFGYSLSLIPSVLRPRDLLVKEFDSVRLQFKSENNKPVNFMGSLITGELLIEQQ